jgi:hypothetical protein
LCSSGFGIQLIRAHGDVIPRWLGRGWARGGFTALILPYIPMRVFGFFVVFLYLKYF